MPTVVPFTIPNLYAGFASARGILRDDRTHLTFEFQVQEDVFQFKGAARRVTVAVDQLAAVTYSRGWFGDTLRIQAASLDGMAELPGSVQGRIELDVEKRHRADAEAFVGRLHEEA